MCAFDLKWAGQKGFLCGTLERGTVGPGALKERWAHLGVVAGGVRMRDEWAIYGVSKRCVCGKPETGE